MSIRQTSHRRVMFRHEDPHRHNYTVSVHAELEFDVGQEYLTQVLAATLPFIMEREPKTLEFISYHLWEKPDGSISSLNGALVRNARGVVLLYAHRVGLDSRFHDASRQLIFDAFDIAPEDQLHIIDQAWPAVEYSVVVDLDPE